ncbi:MAG: hypothetical protein ACK41Q_11940 [Candidatus Brocadia sp.]
MISIRIKLILFTSMLVIIIGTLSCLFFLSRAKRQQEEALKRFGTSLVMLLAQDNEVKHALRSVQPAFLDTPIHRVRELDREEEIGYLRVSNNQAVMLEEKVPWLNIDMKKIPIWKDYQKPVVTLPRTMRTRGGLRWNPPKLWKRHSSIVLPRIQERCFAILRCLFLRNRPSRRRNLPHRF